MSVYATPVSVSQVREQALSGYLYYVFFENAAGASCSSPQQNTQTAYPATAGNFILFGGSSCLWASASGSFAGGECTLILYALAFTFSSTVTVSFTLSVTAQNGNIITSVSSGSITLPGGFQQVEASAFFGCSSFTVPQGGYLRLSLTTSSILLISYGNGAPTDFQVVKNADSA